MGNHLPRLTRARVWLTRAYITVDRNCSSIAVLRYTPGIKAQWLGIRLSCDCSGDVSGPIEGESSTAGARKGER